jgi:hypothetical protein
LRRATAFHAPGRYREGTDLLARTLADRGQDAALLYDLACFESLDGDTDSALAHAGRAVELDPGMRASMARDPDFAALADDPRFQELLS